MTSISERARAKGPLCPQCAAKAKPRSPEKHRRYLALIKAALTHWPDDHEFRPSTFKHLRQWLQCKAGHHEVRTFELPETDNPVMMARMMEFAEALLETQKGTRFGRWRGNTLAVFIPKSIAFEKLEHKAACNLFDEVAAVVEAEVGMSAETLLREAERAA